ncbi:MAG: thermonuclease family protein, partial [Rhodospirillales bacterium]
MIRFLFACAVFMLVAPAPALASALEKGETATVREVVDGDTVVLADGRQVRLTGIQAPKLPLGRAGFS